MSESDQAVQQVLPDQSNTNSSNNSNIYVQIATPKSPNSDGFSPHNLSDLIDHSSAEREIKQKLVDEIDIEILLKHREYNLIQQEISKVESELDTLKRVHEDPEYVKYLHTLINEQKQLNSKQIEQNQQEPASNSWVPSIRKSSLRKQSAENDSSSPPKPPRTSYGGIRPVIDSNGRKICVHKRSDGVIVRVDCPECGRTDFGSAQGFLNHARLAHQIEYKSQEHAALMCGRCLPATEQDELGNSSIRKLKELKMNPDKNLAPGVVIDNGQPLKKKRKSSSKNDEVSGFLEKLYKNNVLSDDFKELVNDVTAKEVIELDDTSEFLEALSNITTSTNVISSTHVNSTANSILLNDFKKNHNRRKSRGGLSAVTFDESSIEYISSPTADGVPIELTRGLEEISDSGQSITDYESQQRLTPAQRRRAPTVPNPLRTRSRSSRENSR